MNDLSKARATLLEVGEESESQRVDNFLMRHFKGVPKSHVYRVLRSGEVRVNSGRVKPDYRLKMGDKVRVPPVRVSIPATRVEPKPLHLPRIYEDSAIMVIDKPSGVAVHGGSGVSYGVIESLRAENPGVKTLELAHRLDRDTSGLLVVAKKRSALLALHRMLREGEVEKYYVAIVQGHWKGAGRTLKESLHRYVTASGERRVRVDDEGQASATRVRPLAAGDEFSLLELQLLTGRTHQIRVHLAHAGHPILGDDKYGDYAANRDMTKRGVKRLFLHARRMILQHPISGERLSLEAPWPTDLGEFAREHLDFHG